MQEIKQKIATRASFQYTFALICIRFHDSTMINLDFAILSQIMAFCVDFV